MYEPVLYDSGLWKRSEIKKAVYSLDAKPSNPMGEEALNLHDKLQKSMEEHTI